MTEQFEENDRVRLRSDKEDCGVVKKRGPYVSEVKFDRGVTRFIPNGWLEKIKK